MEGEVHSDENRALPEKKQKRIVKTPAQIESLEKFYNEHKYPSESMKLQLSEKIGLTEKQVSGWFCHRRLKDKRLPTDEAHTQGKQDRSSGVIQDRGSGLRQDSCGSTKQGDNSRQCDPKEVESRRGTTQASLLPDPRHSIDDTPSRSSSPLQDRVLSKKNKYSTSHGDMPLDPKSVKRTGPSGYLKVKGQVENSAITAVKMQLGRNYREDGPPLGVEFEPLPPGAFETLIRDAVHEPYYADETTGLCSLEDSVTYHQPNPVKIYGRYNSKNYHNPGSDETGYKRTHGSWHHEKSFDHLYKQEPCMSNQGNLFPGRNSRMEMNEDFGGETAAYDVEERSPGGMRVESLSSPHPPPYGKKANIKQPGHWSHNLDDEIPMGRASQNDRFELKPSNLTPKRGEFSELRVRGPAMKKLKEVDGYQERRGINEYPEPVSGENYVVNEARVKRNKGEFAHHMYARKESEGGLPLQSSMNKRSARELPSSFSAETSSSGD